MKILFVHYKTQTFIERDLEILASQHHVRAVDSQHRWRYLVDTLIGVLWCDLVFCWFGSFRALLPALMAKVFRKHCVVVAGGYDVASEPEIDYGNMRGGIRRLVGTTVFRLADRVTTVSRFNTEEARHNANIPEEKIDFIYHGFPGLDSGSVTKDNLVITVGSVNAATTARGLLERNIKIIVADGQHLPFANGIFDVVTCLGSLEHFPDMKIALSEMYRVGKEACRYCIIVPNSNYPLHRIGYRTTLQPLNQMNSMRGWKHLFEPVYTKARPEGATR